MNHYDVTSSMMKLVRIFIKFAKLIQVTMYQVIKGVYEDGKIILEEKPVSKRKMPVIVAFLDERNSGKALAMKKRKLGVLKGKVTIPENFNDPLEELKEYMY